MKKLSVLLAISLIFVIGVLGSSRADGPLNLVRTVPLGSQARDVVVQGNFAYVGTEAGMSILDISNPASPFVRSSVPIISSGGAEGIDVKGSFVYVASRDGGLNIIDVSNPDAAKLVGHAKVSGQAWDVAVKDNVAYVGSFGSGQIQLFDVSNPAKPTLFNALGLPKWTSSGDDETNLARLNSYNKTGNAMVTGVSVRENVLVAVDWGYGRLYYYDVANAVSPVFAGTAYVPFTLKAEADPDRDVVYVFAAFGGPSGLYTIPISAMSPNHSVQHATCSSCDYLKVENSSQGGIGLAPNSPYVLVAGALKTLLYVVDASDTTDVTLATSIIVGKTSPRKGDTIGVASKGDYIFVAAGALGFQVYLYPPLSQ